MGGGGSSYTNWSSKKLSGALRRDSEISSDEFEIELAGLLSDLLASCNARDVQLVQERLDDAKEALQDELEESIDQLFGGSVAKHTYVDGLSDVDCLLVISAEKFKNYSPRKMLSQMKGVLEDRLSREVNVSHGDMALKLEYPDGMTIEMLPTFRVAGRLKIPVSGRNRWSEIDTEAFSKELTQRNRECGGKLIPVIKLAKAAVANFPEGYRPTGYHIESLAVMAFAKYKGMKTTQAMLPHFIERAKELILTAAVDKTGQSTHIDEYLGSDQSKARVGISHLLGRLAKRMRNASAAQSKEQWQALFFPID